jgi:hypothetical protein
MATLSSHKHASQTAPSPTFCQPSQNFAHSRVFAEPCRTNFDVVLTVHDVHLKEGR